MNSTGTQLSFFTILNYDDFLPSSQSVTPQISGIIKEFPKPQNYFSELIL